jgi:hypothetical protein
MEFSELRDISYLMRPRRISHRGQRTRQTIVRFVYFNECTPVVIQQKHKERPKSVKFSKRTTAIKNDGTITIESLICYKPVEKQSEESSKSSSVEDLFPKTDIDVICEQWESSLNMNPLYQF